MYGQLQCVHVWTEFVTVNSGGVIVCYVVPSAAALSVLYMRYA